MAQKSLWLLLIAGLFIMGMLLGTALIGDAQTPTPRPTPISTSAPTATPSMTGDVERGAAVFRTASEGAPACTSCHQTARGGFAFHSVGPNLADVGARAASYAAAGTIDGVTFTSAGDYLRQSILEPSAFIVPTFPNVMYPHYARSLSATGLEDLIAFLLTL